MSEITPQILIQDSLQLFSFPDIYFQISNMISDPRFSTNDIGLVIGRDPALTARLLKLVNSSLYGFQSRVDRVSRAVTLVGMEEIKNLVIATSVVSKFSDIPSDLIDMTDFWLRSVKCGMIAKLLAAESAVLHKERLFLAGLLHDIGSLVFYHKLPNQSLDVLLAANNDRRLIAEFEQDIIGFTHAEQGKILLKSWNLPESLYEAVGCYLTPEKAEQHKLDAYLLSLAARLTDFSLYEGSVSAVFAEYSDEALSMMRLDEAQIHKVMTDVENEFVQIFESLTPNKKFN